MVDDQATGVIELDIETAKQWLEEGSAVMIDVREEREFKKLSIPGVQFMPLSSFDPAQIDVAGGKAIIFQCAIGGRSANAAHLMVSSGRLEKAYNLTGGIKAWKRAGYTTEKGKSPIEATTS